MGNNGPEFQNRSPEFQDFVSFLASPENSLSTQESKWTAIADYVRQKNELQPDQDITESPLYQALINEVSDEDWERIKDPEGSEPIADLEKFWKDHPDLASQFTSALDASLQSGRSLEEIILQSPESPLAKLLPRLGAEFSDIVAQDQLQSTETSLRAWATTNGKRNFTEEQFKEEAKNYVKSKHSVIDKLSKITGLPGDLLKTSELYQAVKDSLMNTVNDLNEEYLKRNQAPAEKKMEELLAKIKIEPIRGAKSEKEYHNAFWEQYKQDKLAQYFRIKNPKEFIVGAVDKDFEKKWQQFSAENLNQINRQLPEKLATAKQQLIDKKTASRNPKDYAQNLWDLLPDWREQGLILSRADQSVLWEATEHWAQVEWDQFHQKIEQSKAIIERQTLPDYIDTTDPKFLNFENFKQQLPDWGFPTETFPYVRKKMWAKVHALHAQWKERHQEWNQQEAEKSAQALTVPTALLNSKELLSAQDFGKKLLTPLKLSDEVYDAVAPKFQQKLKQLYAEYQKAHAKKYPDATASTEKSTEFSAEKIKKLAVPDEKNIPAHAFQSQRAFVRYRLTALKLKNAQWDALPKEKKRALITPLQAQFSRLKTLQKTLKNMPLPTDLGADKLLRQDQLGRQILTGLKIPNPDWDALPQPWRREALKNWWSEYEKKYRPQLAARTTLEKLRRQPIKKSPELLNAKNADDFGKRVLSRLKIKDSVWDSLPKELKKQTTDWLEQEYEKSTNDQTKLSPAENIAALEEAEKLVLDNRATETLKNFPDAEMAAGMLNAFRVVEDLSQKKFHYLSSEGLRAKAALYRQIIPKLQTTRTQLQSALDSLPDSPAKLEQQAAFTQIMSDYEAQKNTYNEKFISPRKALDQLGGVAQALQKLPPTLETKNANDLPAELTENHPFWKAPDWDSAQKLYPHPVGVPTTESLPESVGQQWFGRHLKQQNWAENLADRPPLSSTEFERYLAQQFPAGKDFLSSKLSTELFGIYQLQLAEISAENPEAELSAAEKERADLQFIRELFPANLNLNERWMLEEWGGSLNPQSELQLTALAQNFRQLLHYYPQMNQWFEQDTSGNTALMISLLAKNYGRWFEFRLKALSVQVPDSPEAWVQSLFGEEATDKVTWEWVTHKNPKGWQRFQHWWSGKSSGALQAEDDEISAEDLQAGKAVDTEVVSEEGEDDLDQADLEKDETDEISAENLKAEADLEASAEGEAPDENGAQAPAETASEGKELFAENLEAEADSEPSVEEESADDNLEVEQEADAEVDSEGAEADLEKDEADLHSESNDKEENADDLEAENEVDTEGDSEEGEDDLDQADLEKGEADELSAENLKAETDLEASAEGEITDETAAQAPAETVTEGKEFSAEKWSKALQAAQQELLEQPQQLENQGQYLNALWQVAQRLTPELAELANRTELPTELNDWGTANWEAFQTQQAELSAENLETDLDSESSVGVEEGEENRSAELQKEPASAAESTEDEAATTEADETSAEDSGAPLLEGESSGIDEVAAQSPAEMASEGKEFSAEKWNSALQSAQQELLQRGEQLENQAQYSKALWQVVQRLTPELAQASDGANIPTELNKWGAANWEAFQSQQAEFSAENLEAEANSESSAEEENVADNLEVEQEVDAEANSEEVDAHEQKKDKISVDDLEAEASAEGEITDETAAQAPAETVTEGKELSAEKWSKALQAAQQQLLEGRKQLENQGQYLNALWQVAQRLTPELAETSDGESLPNELNDWGAANWEAFQSQQAEFSAENSETDLDSESSTKEESAGDLEADQVVDAELDSEEVGADEKEKGETDKNSAENLKVETEPEVSAEGEAPDENGAQAPAETASEGKELSAENLEAEADSEPSVEEESADDNLEVEQEADAEVDSEGAEADLEKDEADLHSESNDKEENADDLEAEEEVDTEIDSDEDKGKLGEDEQEKDETSVDNLEAEASDEGESADETVAQSPAEMASERKELSAEKWGKALQAAQQELLEQGKQLENQAQYLNALWQVAQRLTPELAEVSDQTELPTELNDWGVANWEAFQTQQAEISTENLETDLNSESSAEKENTDNLEADQLVDTEVDSEGAGKEEKEKDETSVDNLEAEASDEGESADETVAQSPAGMASEGKELSAEKWNMALQSAQQELLQRGEQLENQAQYLNALWQVAQRLTPELAQVNDGANIPTELNDWGAVNWEAFQSQQAQFSAENLEAEANSESSAEEESADGLEVEQEVDAEANLEENEGKLDEDEQEKEKTDEISAENLEVEANSESSAEEENVADNLEVEQEVDAEANSEENEGKLDEDEQEKEKTDEISAENSELETESEVSAAGEVLDETAEQSPAEMASEGKELSAEKWNTALQSAQQELLESGEQLENQAQYLNALWQVAQRLTPELAQANDGANIPTELNDWGAVNWEAFQIQQAELSAEKLKGEEAKEKEAQKEEKDRLAAAEKAALAAKEANQQQEKRAEEEQKQAEEKEQKEAQQKIPAPLRPLQFLAAGMPPEAMRSTASWIQGSTWSQLGGQLNQRPDWRAQLNKALHQSENMSDEAFTFFMTRFREIYVGQGSVTLDSFLSHWHAYLRWQQPSSPIVKNKLPNAYRSLVIHNVGGLFDYWARAHHQLQGTSIQSLTYQLTDDQGAQAIWFTKKGKQVFPLKIKQTEMP